MSETEIMPIPERAQSMVPAPEPANNILSVIERIASNPDIDVERMRMLLQMRADEEERIRRMDREDRGEAAKRAWLRDFALVQAEIGPIVRSRKNTHTGSNYADLADIERIVTPVLTKHGFSTTAVPMHCDLDGHIRMRLTIGHYEGHERTYEDDFALDAAGSQGKANKTPIQAKGSTQTYARRYLKASALDLSFMDDRDGNAGSRAEPAGVITQAQTEELFGLIDETKSDINRFLAFFGVEGLDVLPAAKFAAARQMLMQKRTAR